MPDPAARPAVQASAERRPFRNPGLDLARLCCTVRMRRSGFAQPGAGGELIGARGSGGVGDRSGGVGGRSGGIGDRSRGGRYLVGRLSFDLRLWRQRRLLLGFCSHRIGGVIPHLIRLVWERLSRPRPGRGGCRLVGSGGSAAWARRRFRSRRRERGQRLRQFLRRASRRDTPATIGISCHGRMVASGQCEKRG